MDPSTEHTFTVTSSVRSADGAGLPAAVSRTFTTAEAPADHNDHGYTGDDARTLSGTIDLSAMSAEAIADTYSIALSLYYTTSQSYWFTFYLPNQEITNDTFDFEVLNLEPDIYERVVIGALSYYEDDYLVHYYNGEMGDQIAPVDLADGDLDLGTVPLFQPNDGRYTGSDAWELDITMDASSVAIFDEAAVTYVSLTRYDPVDAPLGTGVVSCGCRSGGPPPLSRCASSISSRSRAASSTSCGAPWKGRGCTRRCTALLSTSRVARSQGRRSSSTTTCPFSPLPATARPWKAWASQTPLR